MQNITITQDNRNIKKALKECFKDYKVSVVNWKGTAYGWKEIMIETGLTFDEKNKIRESIYKEAYKIIKEVGKCIYTYTDDMNYEHEQVILQVK